AMVVTNSRLARLVASGVRMPNRAKQTGGSIPSTPSPTALSGMSALISVTMGETAATAVRRFSATRRMPSSATVLPAQSGRARPSAARIGCPQDFAHPRHVVLDLGDELRHPVELLHAADVVDEGDLDDPVVEVDLAIEHVGLYLAVRNALEGRVVADRNRCRVALTIDRQPSGIHSVGGNQPLGAGAKVRRRVAEGSTALLAAHNDGSHGRERAQYLAGLPHIALGERLANPGRGRTAALLRPNVVDESDLETVFASGRRERVDGATASKAVTEVAADKDELRVQRLDQHALHELLRRLLTQRAVEGEHERRLHARRREPLDLLLVADQLGRAHGRVQQGERMPIEGHDRRHELQWPRHRQQLADDGAVAGVHSVELADRDGAGAEPLGNLVERGVELHGSGPAVY